MKLGIALEGGGAKGAFHIGVVQACMECGLWPPAAITGTSIGAINGAMLAQGDYNRARNLWLTISGSDLFDADNAKLIYADLTDLDGLSEVWASLKDFITDRGIDTTQLRGLIDLYIDPDRLMNSPIDYGMVTLSLPDFEPVEIFKGEMGQENIPTYILASAALPGFQKVSMGKKFFLDGGLYDNCPVNMLLESGCEMVIAVRTHAAGVIRYDEKDVRVVTVSPSEDLGSILRFSPEQARHNIELGYYDGLRVLRRLGGRYYYLTDVAHGLGPKLWNVSEETIRTIAKSLHLSTKLEPRRLLFERILSLLFDMLELDKGAGYDDLIVAMIEHRAKRCGIERLQCYTALELLELAMKGTPTGRARALDKIIDLLLCELMK
ncbi:MAG: patatin-like phospholipase family protein [Clostridia bacterium]|nr:patatin-like phospholipase family protein [Clostridia bacterium]